MKRFFFYLTLVAQLCCLTTKADESGTCGKNVAWTYVSATRTLTISGSGEMNNYDTSTITPPWYIYRYDIQRVVIEEGVVSIGQGAFINCRFLTSITIPNSVTSIGVFAFLDTAWWNNQADGIVYLNNWLIGYKGDKPSGTISIMEGTRGIASCAFESCNEITSVIIPNSTTIICNGAFRWCSSLTSVTMSNNVTSIGNSAFYDCSSLTTIVLPNSLTFIGGYAFAGCI